MLLEGISPCKKTETSKKGRIFPIIQGILSSVFGEIEKPVLSL